MSCDAAGAYAARECALFAGRMMDAYWSRFVDVSSAATMRGSFGFVFGFCALKLLQVAAVLVLAMGLLKGRTMCPYKLVANTRRTCAVIFGAALSAALAKRDAALPVALADAEGASISMLRAVAAVAALDALSRLIALKFQLQLQKRFSSRALAYIFEEALPSFAVFYAASSHLIVPWLSAVLCAIHESGGAKLSPLRFVPGYNTEYALRDDDREYAFAAPMFTWWDWFTDSPFSAALREEQRVSRQTRVDEMVSKMEKRAARVYPSYSGEPRGAALSAQQQSAVSFRSCLVTGSEGMVGSKLCEMLASRGIARIVCLDIIDLPQGAFEKKAKKFKKRFGAALVYRKMDISSHSDMMKEENNPFKDVEVVFHVAALVGPYHRHDAYYKVNFEGTDNVLSALQRYGAPNAAFVDCSSPSTRFDGLSICGKMESELPYSLSGHEYARTKALAEMLVLESNGTRVASGGKLATCAVAPHQVYGNEDRLFLPSMLETAKQGRLRVFGDGSNVVSFTHVDNIAHALVLAGSKLAIEGSGSDAAGEFFVVTDGAAQSLWDVIDRGVVRAGFPSLFAKLHVPIIVLNAIAYLGAAFHFCTGKHVKVTPFTVNMLIIDRCFCTAKAQEVLGYKPIRELREAWPEAVDAALARMRASE